MREGMITFHLIFIEWKFYEMGVSTGPERSRRTEMQDIREINRSRGVNGTQTEVGSVV